MTLGQGPPSAHRMIAALRDMEVLEGCLPGNIYSYAAATIESLLAALDAAEADVAALADDLACAREQWGSDYLWKKWDLDDALAAHRARIEAGVPVRIERAEAPT